MSQILAIVFFAIHFLFLAASPHAQSVGGVEKTVGAPAESGQAAYGALADTLEDPEARHRLIDELRALAQGRNPAEAQGGDRHGAQDAAQLSAVSGIAVLSQRLGNVLQEVTAQLGSDISATLDAVGRLGSSQGVTQGKLDDQMPALRALGLAIGAALLAYAILRSIAGLLFGRLNAWIRRKPAGEAQAQGQAAESPVRSSPRREGRHRLGRITLSRKLLGVLLALVVDLAASLLAALAGYVAVVGSSQPAYGGAFAFQFLTAFVLIEAVRSISRAVFATRYDELRLLPLQPGTARFWNRWISLLIALTGYCLLVVVPVGQVVFAPSVGRLIGLVIMLCVYITALRVVWSQRLAVRTGLMQRADAAGTAIMGSLLRILARIWHWVALAYFTVLLVTSQADQAAALAFMLSATVQTLIAVVAGALLAAGLRRLELRRIVLPPSLGRNFPSLEQRVNGYKNPALRGLHLALVVIVFLVILDAWHAFDLAAWLDSERGRAAVALVLRVGIVLAIAALSWTVLASLIEHRIGARDGRGASEREKTLLMLFRNAAAITIATMTVLIVLSQIGIDIGPLIAGAGVVGLAIGFGAQKLVQDVITGVFIQLENGMNQNDIVEVAGRFGTVEKITVRSVVVRTLDGGYHLIPFSAIDTVSNHTRDFGYHYAEYNIAHREDVDQAVAELELAFKDLMEDPALAAQVLSEIEIPGVTALNERGFTVRVLIKTTPGNQWMIQRGFNRLVKRRFDAAGIELPYPQAVVHFGRDENGHAAPTDAKAIEVLRQSTQTAS
ncbi:mechanosensitive ion channel [Alcaligenaceae bacterium]|nr:mechanosensitive ion channel [Alcaligenaceae bacterium]